MNNYINLCNLVRLSMSPDFVTFTLRLKLDCLWHFVGFGWFCFGACCALGGFGAMVLGFNSVLVVLWVVLVILVVVVLCVDFDSFDFLGMFEKLVKVGYLKILGILTWDTCWIILTK